MEQVKIILSYNILYKESSYQHFLSNLELILLQKKILRHLFLNNQVIKVPPKCTGNPVWNPCLWATRV